MFESQGAEAFLAGTGPILDVRGPVEFERGHVPGAVSFPLFTDEERSRVGRCYKRSGSAAAVELGFEFAGPRCASFVRRARDLATEGSVRVHCWRGGMRSQSMAWVLRVAGLDVHVLDGGYKAYRRWVRTTLAEPRGLVVVGGMTGTAKTALLHELAGLGEAVLDLEGLANHRGSSFGGLAMPPQPTTEHFENLLAERWSGFRGRDLVWVEAESRRVGTCYVPDELFRQMESAPTVEVLRSQRERIDWLVESYGDAPVRDLVAATERIHKRLGGDRAKDAIDRIEQGRLDEACEIILRYYDRAYRYDLERRGKDIPQVDLTGLSIEAGARALRSFVRGATSPPLARNR